MKQKLLNLMTALSLFFFFVALILHVLGFFTFWESRWHLYLYAPILGLWLITLIWKIAFRVPKKSFGKHVSKPILFSCILLAIYLFCFWWINIFTTVGGAGYCDNDGAFYLNSVSEESISESEYHTLRRAAYQMSTEPLAASTLLPVLFFTTRFRQSLRAAS